MAKPIWERKPENMLSTEARNWLAELQEEWNGLQEKAEEWDKLQNSELLHDIIVNASKLEAVKTHLEDYPDEKDDKYLLGRPLGLPHTAGPHVFNSVLFLTHLETWHKGLKKILEAEG